MGFIESKDNKTIKYIKKLKQKKYRDIENKFIAEGWKFLVYDYIPELIIVKLDKAEEKKIKELLEKFQCKKIIVSDKIFADISSQENSQGIIVIYNKKEQHIDSIKGDVVVLDDVSDPGNLGTIIRICDATNFKNIIVTENTVDAYNEKVVRATMGSIFNVNLYVLKKENIIQFLKEKNYSIISTCLSEDSQMYNKIKLENKNAIVFGNEGNGISDDLIKISNKKIIIPLLGKAESLNVAVATGIVLYKMREIEGVI